MLVSIVMYVLGVPLWMLLGMVVLIVWNNKRVKKQQGAFPVKVKPEIDPDSNKKSNWSRTVSYAQWIHDVLIVRKRPGLMLTVPYGIKGIEGYPQDADPEEIKGLGDHPKLIKAVLDDGSILQVAVGELHTELAPDHF